MPRSVNWSILKDEKLKSYQLHNVSSLTICVLVYFSDKKVNKKAQFSLRKSGQKSNET
jgi:hypothetical protein